MGADGVASSATAFRDLCIETSGNAGVDCVLITAETSSSDPVNLAGGIARDRAVVVAVGTVGMDIERKAYYEKELDFRVSRSYGPGRYDAAYEQKGRDYPIGYVRWTETRNMEAFVQVLAERKVDVGALITHRFSIERAQSAYDLITGKSGEPFLGVVIQYSDAGPEAPKLSVISERVNAAMRPTSAGVSVGLLGAGVFAAGTLVPVMKAAADTTLVGVCSATGSHAQHLERKFGFQSCTTNEDGLIRDPNVNAVVIATRHHQHANQVLSALAAGKHVFCEKPLCLSEDELRSIVDAYLGIAPAQRPALMVGFNRRFAPMTARMKAFLAPITEPLALHYRVNAGQLPPDHWVNDREQGGGRILGEVCHFVDLLMFLAGSPVVEVDARPIGNSARYSGENVLISLRFANGSEGTISYLANGDRAFSKERIEVFGGGSTTVLDDFRRLELVRGGRKETIHSRWCQDKGHASEWDAFAKAVRHQGGAPIPFEEIVGSTLATFRVNESAATGERLVVDAAAFLGATQRSRTPKSALNTE
jgi:predicted dehydrogenase